MEFLTQAQGVLDYISDQAGIEPFSFDDQGRAFFTANDLSFLFYALEEEKTLVTAIYMGQPDLKDAQFLYSVLCGNHMWEFTGGGTLSIDRDTGHLVLTHSMVLPIEEISEVGAVFANLLGAAEYWKKSIPDTDGAGAGLSGDAIGGHFIRV